MLAFLGLLTGLAGPIAQATASITDLLKAKTTAKSDKDLAEINSELERVHDKKAVLVAMAGNRVFAALFGTAVFALALGPITYVLKYYSYDKVYGALYGCAGKIPFRTMEECTTFATDPLNLQMTAVLTAVLGFFFLWTKRD